MCSQRIRYTLHAPRRGGPHSWQPLLKTRSLIAALATVLLASCASPGGRGPHVVSIGISLLGSERFCVFDVSWEVEKLQLQYSIPPVFAKCTRDVATSKGFFVSRGEGSYAVRYLETAVVVNFRRAPEGPMARARFDLKNVKPKPGFRVSGLTPYISESDVQMRVDFTEDVWPRTGKERGYSENFRAE